MTHLTGLKERGILIRCFAHLWWWFQNECNTSCSGVNYPNIRCLFVRAPSKVRKQTNKVAYFQRIPIIELCILAVYGASLNWCYLNNFFPLENILFNRSNQNQGMACVILCKQRLRTSAACKIIKAQCTRSNLGLFYNQGTSSVSVLVKSEMFCNSTTCFLLYYE